MIPRRPRCCRFCRAVLQTKLEPNKEYVEAAQQGFCNPYCYRAYEMEKAYELKWAQKEKPWNRL